MIHMIMRLAPSSIPVAMLEVSSDNLTPAELYNLAYMRIRPLLVTVNGAILPHPYGGQDMQVMVNLDQQKLLARHLTPADVHEALMRQYLVIPSGDIKIKQVRDRLTINMVDRVLFDSGQAQVKPAGLKVLKQVSDILKKVTDKQITDYYNENKAQYSQPASRAACASVNPTGLSARRGGTAPARHARCRPRRRAARPASSRS